MTNIVDQLFPPVNMVEESVEFSNFNYWRDPVDEMLDLNLDFLTLPSTAATATASSTTTQGQSAVVTNTLNANKSLATIPENHKV